MPWLYPAGQGELVFDHTRPDDSPRPPVAGRGTWRAFGVKAGARRLESSIAWRRCAGNLLGVSSLRRDLLAHSSSARLVSDSISFDSSAVGGRIRPSSSRAWPRSPAKVFSRRHGKPARWASPRSFCAAQGHLTTAGLSVSAAWRSRYACQQPRASLEGLRGLDLAVLCGPSVVLAPGCREACLRIPPSVACRVFQAARCGTLCPAASV